MMRRLLLLTALAVLVFLAAFVLTTLIQSILWSPAAEAAEPLAKYRHAPQDQSILLPDPHYTPGGNSASVVRTTNAADLCPVAHTKDVRNVPPAVAAQVYALYGAVKKAGVCCEVDHLCSLEHGCNNDKRNLWPQPWAQARMKDRLENWLHRAICSGAMTVEEAQRKISTNWYGAYLEMRGGRP